MPIQIGSTANLLWGLLFGAVGFVYFYYGRKQKRAVPFICGLALMGFPYFVDNTYAVAAIGAALCALPYFIS